MMSKITKNAGFTLVELMIVVAIVAIIVAVAVPSYNAQSQTARWADCNSVMTQSRQALERFYSKNFTYTGAQAGTDIPDKCPIDGDAEYYTVGLNVADGGTSYTITAAAGEAQTGDGCGDLSITQAGVKDCGADSCTIDRCW